MKHKYDIGGNVTALIMLLIIAACGLTIVRWHHNAYHFEDKGYRYCMNVGANEYGIEGNTDCAKYLGIVKE